MNCALIATLIIPAFIAITTTAATTIERSSLQYIAPLTPEEIEYWKRQSAKSAKQKATEDSISDDGSATTQVEGDTYQQLFQDIYINCGSTEDITDSNSGIVWKKDDQYSTALGKSYSDCPKTIINSTIDERVLCSERWFDSTYESYGHGYEIPVSSSGTYAVSLYFTEMFFQEAGKRVFGVKIEGTVVRDTFDILQEAGGAYIAVEIAYDVTVTDGNMSIELTKIEEHPKISAIAIRKYVEPDQLVDSGSTDVSVVQPLGQPTYVPGNLIVEEEQLLLSEGLTAKLIGQMGVPATLYNGTLSAVPVHTEPDAGACFVDPRPNNPGGWIYVSNSEQDPSRKRNVYTPGGVGAFTFDKDGNLIDYKRVLDDTRDNCGGGKTEWGAWISGEEYKEFDTGGYFWQVDPTGERPGEIITMSLESPGPFESFAYDTRIRTVPRFFGTKDDTYGELRRFTPTEPNWDDPWTILTGDGTLDYLMIVPDVNDPNRGTFYWDTSISNGRQNAYKYFPNAEGIDKRENELYFISKTYKSMFILDLDAGTYTNQTTVRGLFDGEPDQVKYLVGSDGESLLYFTEDADQQGTHAGIHARDGNGLYYTILESHELSHETTGLAFSPDAKHMYIAYQVSGMIFDITRKDGLPFNAKTLNVKYHYVDTI